VLTDVTANTYHFLPPRITSLLMPSIPKSDIISVETSVGDTESTVDGSNESTPLGNYESDDLFLPLPKTNLRRQYSSLQEHADKLQGDKTHASSGGATSRHEGRRESVVWDLQPADERLHKHSRNPLLMQQPSIETPPTLEELLHRPRNEDANGTHNASLLRVDSLNSQPARERPISVLTMYSTSSSVDTAKSSEAGIRRGEAKHVFDLEMFSTPRLNDQQQNNTECEVRAASPSPELKKSRTKDRRLSFMLLSSLKHKPHSGEFSTSALVAKEPTSIPNFKQLPPQSLVKSSLRNRRQLSLDLSLPTEILNLPARSRQATVHFNNVAPLQPQSPQTQWEHNERPEWQHGTPPYVGPSTPDDCVAPVSKGDRYEEPRLMPDNDLIRSSQSPQVECPAFQSRDRCYLVPPSSLDIGSSQKKTIDALLPQTTDGCQTAEDAKVSQQRQARTHAELQQLSQASKSARACRWRWARSQTRSSEDAGQGQTGESSSRRFSTRSFKRSGRFSDRANNGKHNEQSSASIPSRLWWIGKQPVDSAQPEPANTSANSAAPPPMHWPDQNSIPSTPKPDITVELKGKLAGFFFEDSTGMSVRKPKASPGGHWDSDALLMDYLSTDKNGEEEEEEGPEGPLTSSLAPRSFTVDHNPGFGSPGLLTPPVGYLGVKGMHPGQVVGQEKTSLPGDGEVWYRVRHDYGNDEEAFTVDALKEKKDRAWFEWVVPEHLPNSPLCPIHAKYHGYKFGKCYWHGRKKSEGEDRARGEYEGGEYDTGNQDRKLRRSDEDGSSPKIRSGTRDWEVGKFEVVQEAKKRRLASLSDS
jgi:hypothetical protein